MNWITTYASILLQGVSTTITAWAIATIISLIVGTVLGIVSCNYIASTTNKRCIRLYTFVFKGIPAYVQILIFYFVVPQLLHINISGFVAGTIALGLCSSGYLTEIVRTGINNIPTGQWDAAFVLGYPIQTTIRRIILPQLVDNLTVPLIGELEQLLKSTTLLATIGVTDVTRVGMNIISRELNPLPVYSAIACIYLLFAALLQLLIIWHERKVIR